MGPRVGFAASASVGVGRRDEVDAARGKRMASAHAPDGEIRARRHDTGLPRARNPNRKDKTATVAEHQPRQPCRSAARRSIPFPYLGRRRSAPRQNRPGRRERRTGHGCVTRTRASTRGGRSPGLPCRAVRESRPRTSPRAGRKPRSAALVEARVLPQQQVVTGKLGPAQAKLIARQPLHEVTRHRTRRILLADDGPRRAG